MVWCAHCRKHFPRDAFDVKRRERRRLYSGQRVKSATHHRGHAACHLETEYPDSAELGSDKLIAQTQGR